MIWIYNNFFLIPKLDINDRFIINENEIENKDVSKINILLKKYIFFFTLNWIKLYIASAPKIEPPIPISL